MQRPQPIIFPGIPDLAHEQIYLKTSYGSDRFQGGDFSFHSFGGLDSDMQIISAIFQGEVITAGFGKISTIHKFRLS
jgi:hypothetical protein